VLKIKALIIGLLAVMLLGCDSSNQVEIRKRFPSDRVYRLYDGTFLVIRPDGNICHASINRLESLSIVVVPMLITNVDAAKQTPTDTCAGTVIER